VIVRNNAPVSRLPGLVKDAGTARFPLSISMLTGSAYHRRGLWSRRPQRDRRPGAADRSRWHVIRWRVIRHASRRWTV